MKRLLSFPAVTPALFGIVCVLAYGGWVHALGFTWDDWPYLWIGHLFGPSGYPAFVASDRPFSAWIFMLTFALFGEEPLGYHLLALVLRWAGAMGFWLTLRQVWPGRAWAAAAPALLFLVYPAFSQQPVALVYNHHFSVLALFTTSLAGMLWAARQPADHKGRAAAVSLLSLVGAAGMFSLEYYAALELLRPLLLALVLRRTGIQRISLWLRVTRAWLPYALLLAAFLFWRVFIFGFPSYDPVLVGEIQQTGLSAVVDQGRTILLDILEGGLLAWKHAWPTNWPALPEWGAETSGAAAFLLRAGLLSVVGVVTAAAVALVARQAQRNPSNNPSRVEANGWAREALLLGVVAVCLAGWPFWFTHLDLRLEGLRDRLTLAFIPGSALLVTGLIGLLFKDRLPALILVTALVGGSVGWQAANGGKYAREWQEVKNFFWQLTWRAPGLQPGTSLLTNDIPFERYSDNSLTAPLNWTYAPDFHGVNMPYLLDFISVRLGAGLTGLDEGAPVVQDYRSLSFSGTTSQSLVLVYQPPGCMRVITPENGPVDTSLPELVRQAAPVSHLDQILNQVDTPAQPPLHIFGPEPGFNWCMAYQKASLAAQQGDWAGVVAMGDRAYATTSGPQAGVEHVLFAEGYARLGNLDRAADLLRQAVAKDENARPETCQLFRRLARAAPPEASLAGWIDQTEVQVGCE